MILKVEIPLKEVFILSHSVLLFATPLLHFLLYSQWLKELANLHLSHKESHLVDLGQIG